MTHQIKEIEKTYSKNNLLTYNPRVIVNRIFWDFLEFHAGLGTIFATELNCLRLAAETNNSLEPST